MMFKLFVIIMLLLIFGGTALLFDELQLIKEILRG